MLPQKNRLTKKDFQTILKEGSVFSTNLLRFHFIKSNNCKFAFVSPSSIFKNATKRNKLRRIGYNILRSLKIKNVNGIFFYKKQAMDAPVNEIKDSVVFIFKKIGTTK